jgi:hypothetical protein
MITSPTSALTQTEGTVGFVEIPSQPEFPMNHLSASVH